MEWWILCDLFLKRRVIHVAANDGTFDENLKELKVIVTRTR